MAIGGPVLWGLLSALAAGSAVGALLATLLWRQTARRRRAERDAARQGRQATALARTLAGITEAVVATDLQRRITWVNAGFTRMTGYTAEEAVGRSPGELLQCEQTAPLTIARMREALGTGQAFTGELVNRARDGRLYRVELRIRPVHDEAGRLAGFIAFQIDVTERRRAEAVLQDSLRLLNSTGRIGGIGGWRLDTARRELSWTDQTCRMLDLEPGHRPRLREVLRLLDAEGRRRLLAPLRRGGAHRPDWEVELPVRTAAGRALWVRVVAEVEYGDHGAEQVAGAVQDITHKRQLRAEAQRQAGLLREAFEVVDGGIALFDAEDRLAVCNERFRALYGDAPALLEPGARFEDLVRHGAYAGRHPAAVGREEAWIGQQLAAHRAGDRTLVQRMADGRILRVVDRRMRDGHTLAFRVDITELVRATEAAEAADRAKSEFIATVSHELRTPLQAITGFSDLGKHFAAGHAQYGPMFRDIHDAGMRMLRLVNGLLDMSKIDGTLGSMTLVPTRLVPLLHGVAHELHGLAEQRGVRLVLPSPAAGLAADVDTFRFQQVLRNLLANALRFAPPHSCVEVGARALGAQGIEIAVRDHGPGVPEDELERIFEPFVQSSRTRDGSGGTGLGLAISRRIMGAHGGTVRAANAAGGGAIFTLWLPPASGPVPDAAPPPAAPRRLLRPPRPPITKTPEDTACPLAS